MNLPESAQLSTPSRFSFLESARKKIAILAVGLAAGTPACSFCYSWNLNDPKEALEAKKEEARRQAVNEGGTKVIHVDKADATIAIKRIPLEKCRGKLEMVFGYSQFSPLHDEWGPLENVRSYDLPRYARPWTRVTAYPEGLISLRMKGDVIAVEFTCDSPNEDDETYCSGKEVDPAELDEKIAVARQTRDEKRAQERVEQKRKKEEEEREKKKKKESTGDKDEADNKDDEDEGKDNENNEDNGDDKDKNRTPSESVEVNLVAFRNHVTKLRAKKGLPPLNYGECALAMSDYWATHPAAPAGGHSGGGEDKHTKLERAGCASLAAENVSWPNNFDPAHIYQQWEDSPPHKAAMERDDITEMGLSCVKNTGVKSDNFCVWIGVKLR